ncbi:hypothetical protein [Thermus caldilimi]|uniref:hypothetical protein n=1 Tax=Thermus caldilimi TaxID=2483360 RepID=UPI00197F35B7|nr:hypothetical protein [Thermus caldilimi]
MIPRVLGYGVDTFRVNLYWDEGRYQLPEGLEAALDNLKDLYRQNPGAAILWGVDAYFPLPRLDGSVNIISGDLPLYEAALVQPTRHYAWQLSFANLLFVRLSAVRDTTRRASFPAVVVEITGTYMMQAGRDVRRVVDWVMEAATNLVGTRPSRVQVSRVDLFADIEVPHGAFHVEDIARFTSRARSRSMWLAEGQVPAEGGAAPSGGPMSNTPPAIQVPASLGEAPATMSVHLRGHTWSGFTFGRGPLLARVYSKTLEAKTKPASRLLLKAYEEVHGALQGEVVRVEFQLTPEVLAEMVVPGDGVDVRDWDVFGPSIPAIWAYLTESWLVLRDKATYLNYSVLGNAPVDPLWRLVQGAFREGGDTGKAVRVKWQAQVDVLSLAKQALGAYLTALAAVGKAGKVNLLNPFIALFRVLAGTAEDRKRFVEEAKVSYFKGVETKQARFGYMPERMAYGGV